MSNNIVDSIHQNVSTKRTYPVPYNAGKQVQVVSYNNINSYNTLGQGQSVSYNDNNGYDIENPLGQGQSVSYNDNRSYDIDYSFLEDTLDSVIDYEVFQVIFE
jgi:hypothetical protein